MAKVKRLDLDLPLVPETPVLPGESRRQFEDLVKTLERDRKPRDAFEKILTLEFAQDTWDSARYRRWKVGIVSSTFPVALTMIVQQLLREPEQYGFDVEESAEEIARAWFTDAEVKEKVRELLRTFDLDESVIEAKAAKLALPEIEKLDGLLASSALRRNMMLRVIHEYREAFGKDDSGDERSAA